jgi:flagellar motor switch protein FliG
MKVDGGPKAAALMLQGLGPGERKRILDDIRRKDPKMAQAIEVHLLTLEDLKKLSVKMLQEFLREVDTQDLGLALRLSSVELREHLLGMISTGMREDLELVLKGALQPVEKVQEAYQRVLSVMNAMQDKGLLVFHDDDQLV